MTCSLFVCFICLFTCLFTHACTYVVGPHREYRVWWFSCLSVLYVCLCVCLWLQYCTYREYRVCLLIYSSQLIYICVFMSIWMCSWMASVYFPLSMQCLRNGKKYISITEKEILDRYAETWTTIRLQISGNDRERSPMLCSTWKGCWKHTRVSLGRSLTATTSAATLPAVRLFLALSSAWTSSTSLLYTALEKMSP